MSDFREIIIQAQNGSQSAVVELMDLIQPMLEKYSIVNHRHDEDLSQHLLLCFLHALKEFRI